MPPGTSLRRRLFKLRWHLKTPARPRDLKHDMPDAPRIYSETSMGGSPVTSAGSTPCLSQDEPPSCNGRQLAHPAGPPGTRKPSSEPQRAIACYRAAVSEKSIAIFLPSPAGHKLEVYFAHCIARALFRRNSCPPRQMRRNACSSTLILVALPAPAILRPTSTRAPTATKPASVVTTASPPVWPSDLLFPSERGAPHLWCGTMTCILLMRPANASPTQTYRMHCVDPRQCRRTG